MTDPPQTDRPSARAAGAAPWIVAAIVAAAACALLPFQIIDGDSCVYSSLGRDMAAGGWRTWVAPQWDFHGALDCFHEHPPGAFWATAAVASAGIDTANASLVANALWALLAAGGLVAATRRLTGDAGAALVAGAVFLLHATPLKCVQRAALDFPFAACSVWAVAAALRLRDSRVWSAVLAVALAGAFLTRGVFAAAPAVVVGALLLDASLRPPIVRLAAGLAGAVALLLAFDLLHAAATGHGFWRAYFERQVLASFGKGGTRHSHEGPTLPYYLSRVLVFSLPWSLVALVRLTRYARGVRPLECVPAWRLAAVWLALAVAGPALTSRPTSRYLFQAWLPASIFVAVSFPRAWSAGLVRPLAWAVPLLVPALAVGKYFVQPVDDEWRAAAILEKFRAARTTAARPVRGPFLLEDDSRKFFLRFHLAADVRADLPAAPRDADLWVPAGAPVPPDATVLVTTPLGSLVRKGR